MLFSQPMTAITDVTVVTDINGADGIVIAQSNEPSKPIVRMLSGAEDGKSERREED